MKYREIGLAIALCAFVLAIYTYIFLGIVPLLALWIGLTIVGTSMFLTPEEPRLPPSAIRMILDAFENLEKLIELLALGSYAVYVPRNEAVYAYVSNDKISLEIIEKIDVSKLIHVIDGRKILVLRIPLPAVEESDVCSAIDVVLTDTLGIADMVECNASDERIALRFVNPVALGFSRMERVLGALQTVFSAAIAAKVLGRIVEVERQRREGNDLIAILKTVNSIG